MSGEHLARIRSEYHEMPGLKLTAAQASRFWSLSPDDSRVLLDTLVDAGVARSRSHALAWCVRLVAGKQEEWLAELREALTHVERARKEGPQQ